MAKKLSNPSELPTNVVLAGISFSVEMVVLEDKYGDCDVSERKIRINPEKSPEMQWQTLFHECMHAVIGLSGITEMITDAQEEALCECMDNLLWPVLRFR